MILRNRTRIAAVVDPGQLLDLLTPPLGGRRVSYQEYLRAVAANPEGRVEGSPGFEEETLRRSDVRELPGAVGRIQARSAQARIEPGTPMRIVTPPKTWAYAAELPLTIPPDARGGIRVRIRARVVCGEAGLGVLHRNEKSFQHRKFLRAGGAEEETIFLRVEDPLEARSVIIENATPDGQAAEVLLSEVAVVIAG